ncbi:hypothetical protein [Croceibacterium salegens]|uniref:hypothetical protein n=1 Tax=Croceibacterium salegens TaxID=1737568 RepID=UPI001915B7C4|nr:hypothetical protein [Croceibacterium salegens]
MGKFLKVAAAAACFVSAAAVSAQDPATINGHPNINGIWQAMNEAKWDLEPHSAATQPNKDAERAIGAQAAIPASLGVVQGGSIPYTDEARKARDEKRAAGLDPEKACYLPGIPRATYMGYPFQIVQGGGDILMAYEYASANRVIDIGEVGIPPIDTWMGTSYGQWEGNTLVVVTLAQNGETWLDRAGNYVAPTTTVTERFTPRGPNVLDYSVTFDDPNLYTKPWTIKMPLYRRLEENAQLLEFKCVPFAEMYLYGDLYDTMDDEAKKRLGLEK